MLSPIALIAFGFGRPREEGDMKNAGIPPIHGDGAHPKIEMRRRTLDSVASAWPLPRLDRIARNFQTIAGNFHNSLFHQIFLKPNESKDARLS